LCPVSSALADSSYVQITNVNLGGTFDSFDDINTTTMRLGTFSEIRFDLNSANRALGATTAELQLSGSTPQAGLVNVALFGSPLWRVGLVFGGSGESSRDSFDNKETRANLKAGAFFAFSSEFKDPNVSLETMVRGGIQSSDSGNDDSAIGAFTTIRSSVVQNIADNMFYVLELELGISLNNPDKYNSLSYAIRPLSFRYNY